MLIDQLRANVEALSEDGPTTLSRLLEQAADELEDVVEILDRLDRAEAALATLQATLPSSVGWWCPGQQRKVNDCGYGCVGARCEIVAKCGPPSKSLNLEPAPEPLGDERQLLLRAQRHGGAFMAHLATAWLFADPANAGKLRAGFGGLLARYASAPAVEEE